MEIIVFNNEELIHALSKGVRDICLCDNSFDIPAVPNVVYSAIGDVTVSAPSRSVCCGKNIVFLNFPPDYSDYPMQAEITPANKRSSCGSGSYSSFFSSYRLESSSYSGSYRIVSSYAGSYPTSYGGSFKSGNKVIYVNGYGIDLI